MSVVDSQHWPILMCLCFFTTDTGCQGLVPENTLKIANSFGALFLNCSVYSHASWKRFVTGSDDVNGTTISVDGTVFISFDTLFQIEGQFNTIFLKPRLEQAGQYGCHDQTSGVDKRAEVVMLGEYHLQS